jgi:hypothetical protein
MSLSGSIGTCKTTRHLSQRTKYQYIHRTCAAEAKLPGQAPDAGQGPDPTPENPGGVCTFRHSLICLGWLTAGFLGLPCLRPQSYVLSLSPHLSLLLFYFLHFVPQYNYCIAPF